MRHRTRHRVLYVLFLLTVPVFLCGAIEALARTQPLDPNRTIDYQSLLSPETKAVDIEYLKLGWIDKGYQIPADAKGAYINIVDGERLTIGQPTNARHDLYLFGNSIAFDAYVSDKHTMASQLQAMLPDYHVHNLGEPGATTILMLARLKDVKLHPDDIVLFYDGINEVESIRAAIHNDHQFGPCQFLAQHVDDLRIGSDLCSNFTEQSYAAMRTPADYQNVEVPVLQQYAQILGRAKLYAESSGATFYNILQPYLYSSPLSRRERRLITATMGNVDAAGDLFTKVESDLANIKPDITLDLTHALDVPRRQGIEVYADTFHYNAIGDSYVARAIYSAIWQTF